MHTNFDVIIIGGGSVGTPLALYLAQLGLRVLVVEKNASIGQGSNKTAIGGIRATHSDFTKIHLCQHSLKVFSTWKDKYGDDIEWQQGGYIFLAHSKSDQEKLSNLTKWQVEQGLDIQYLSPLDLVNIVPFLNPTSLLGGTFSPNDGHASSLLAIYSMFLHAQRLGASFHFNENCGGFITEKNKIIGIFTNKKKYYSKFIIIANGAWAADLCGKLQIHLQVTPDAHEAGITEPVQKFFSPLIVDMRQMADSENFYFYQNALGQVMFCLTPYPQQWGFNTEESSRFLPLAAQRLIEIMPICANLRVRRVWRGLYPMTPDGLPYIGIIPEYDGLILAVGMCGQGFMLGPGIADLLSRLIVENLTHRDHEILEKLSHNRKSTDQEMLK